MSESLIESVRLLIALTIVGSVCIALGVALENAVLGVGGAVFLILPIFAVLSEVINSLK